MQKREPTVAERLLALVRKRDPKQYFSRADDFELQLDAVPVHDRPLLALLQKLTIALNPDHIFDSKHLGAHDYVQIDAYLRSDLYRSLRSHTTKEVYLPEWSDTDQSRYPQCAVLIVVQNLKDVHDTLALATATVAEAQQVLSDLSQQRFERLLTIQDDEVFAATAQIPPQARSGGAGTKRQMHSPTFSEEIDKLARKAGLRPTPQPIGDIPMDEPHQVAHVAQLGQGSVAYQQFPHAVAAEEEVSAQVATPVVVPAQVAAQPMASMQAVAAPSALFQPIRISLERAVSSDTAELVQDLRSIFRQRDFTPPLSWSHQKRSNRARRRNIIRPISFVDNITTPADSIYSNTIFYISDFIYINPIFYTSTSTTLHILYIFIDFTYGQPSRDRAAATTPTPTMVPVYI
ncbi:unnamed protein product [Heligmosomoides polygyrus]|uniref:Reverse transcriptase n=1 Tax=Heligmosomoides polygyrus TaxID=6339 RepID=A0A183FZR0_HELPZ|nr:unnamed protein product [Heligmosomoides polygyrus]